MESNPIPKPRSDIIFEIYTKNYPNGQIYKLHRGYFCKTCVFGLSLCLSCQKQRVFYSAKRLTKVEKSCFEIVLNGVDFRCGSPVVSDTHPNPCVTALFGKVVTNTGIYCGTTLNGLIIQKLPTIHFHSYIAGVLDSFEKKIWREKIFCWYYHSCSHCVWRLSPVEVEKEA